MKFSFFTLEREELVSDPFGLPYGRRIVAVLETNPGVPAGSAPREPDSLQLVVETRDNREDPFVELVRSAVITGSGTVEVELPAVKAPDVGGGLPPPPPSARLRVLHVGRLMPRFSVTLVGL